MAAARHRWRLAGAVLVALAAAASCSSSDGRSAPSTPTTTTTPTVSRPVTTAPSTVPSGPDAGGAVNGIRLAHAARPVAAAGVAVVGGTPLDAAGVQAVVDRLPSWDPGAAQVVAFDWPASTLSPPLAPTTQVPLATGDDAAPPATPSGPLHVLRTQPTGDVAMAPFLSITFDQPMVPVATVAQLDDADVPATLAPAVPGRWQWIGTRTLRFDATDGDGTASAGRLPGATHYTVTVPAGTTSATGGVLAQAVVVAFETPPATVQSLVPSGDELDLQPVFVAAFDQRVDPDAVLAVTTLRAGDQTVALRVATADEVAADETAQRATASLLAGQWVAFRPVAPLPADAAVSITFGPHVPSAEGPDTFDAPDSFDGRTFAPLRVTTTDCGFDSGCHPGDQIVIQLTNQLDATTFDPASVTISPAVPAASIGVSGKAVVVSAATVANTAYSIGLPADLADVHGQRLGDTEPVQVEVGDARPALQPFANLLTTLDPFASSATLPVVSIGHRTLRVRTYAIDDGDWAGFPEQVSSAVYARPDNATRPGELPYELIDDRTVDVDGDVNAVSTTELDLDDVLANHDGRVVVRVDVDGSSSANDFELRTAITWVQRTTIGVDVAADARTLHAFVTDLRSGAAIGSAMIDALGANGRVVASATTAGDGTATIDLTTTPIELLRVTAVGSVALAPPDDFAGGWQRADVEDQIAWYVFTDRGVYRPGETVSVKGWMRQITTSGDAQVELSDAAPVQFVGRDGAGNEIADGTAEVDPLGGFHLTFTVPDGANAGMASLSLTRGTDTDQGSGLSYQIEDYRTPEFAVASAADDDGPYVRGTPLTVSATATYFAGGALPAAPVDWQVSAAAATYSPPGWDGFDFGRWTPWWLHGPEFVTDSGGPSRQGAAGDEPQHFAGVTNGSGADHLQIDVGSLGVDLDGYPVSVTVQPTVTDVNRQAWSSTTSLLVHPAQRYVGLRTAGTFVDAGVPLAVEVIVTDIDGHVLPGVPVTLTTSRMESRVVDGEWTAEPVDPQTCSVTSAEAVVTCQVQPSTGGQYQLVATVADEQGRQSHTELTRWVGGATAGAAPRTIDAQTLTVVPESQDNTPGGTARLLVQAPFAGGEGVLTATHGSITGTYRFTLDGASAVVEVPIAEADVPGLAISAEVVGVTARTGADGAPVDGAPPRPAFATGQLQLPISLASRTLAVHAVPRATDLLPGAGTTIDVDVTDASGRPAAGAELAVVVVDEAALAVDGYELPDPLDVIYADLPGMLRQTYGRGRVVLADPAQLFPAGGGAQGDDRKTSAEAAGSATTTAAGTTAPMAGGAAQDNAAVAAPTMATGGSSTPIDVRSNFVALAAWVPSVATDAAGHATVDIALPDNLTRYRVMVVAAAGAQQFGTAEANITARLPLMIRPSAPRFANVGDRFELPVVVQNQTDSPMDVDVVLQTANLDPATPAGVRVNVPANDRVEVRFPVSVAAAGTARFRVAGASGSMADSATVELPVHTPATAEAVATYGVLDDGATLQPVATPTDVLAAYGGLDITTSSTALAGLTDALANITNDPYDSSYALATRITTIAALRDVLAAFASPDLPSPAELDAIVGDDITALVAMQLSDGGFGWWSGDPSSSPFTSLQAASALGAAKAAGYPVPEAALTQALGYASAIEQHIPDEWSDETRFALMAEALSVRAANGDRDPGGALSLYRRAGDRLTLGALARLWPVLDDQSAAAGIERTITNSAVDTAGAVAFTTDVHDDAAVTLSSDRRTDALVLDAFLQLRPTSDLVPKVVTGLLASRVDGHWGSVAEDGAILLALRHYFDAFEHDDPSFTAAVFVAGRLAGDESFDGRSTNQDLLTVPTADLLAGGAANADVVIGHEGNGRLYYRIGLRTAPADLRLDPLDRGFVVARTYEAVDDPADVRRDPDGTWHVRAGARVRVRLTMVAESRRDHVALVDSLPAGFEAQNPALTTTPDVPTDSSGGTGGAAPVWQWWSWFDHQNLRDSRAEAFANSVDGGTYDWSYVALATTPGSFVAPPARAEEIYAPETFGRTATDTVVVDA